MKFIIIVNDKEYNVDSKENLFRKLFEIFSKFNIIEHTQYLKSKNFTQKDFLRYGTLGTYSLFLISQDFTDISKFNYEISDTKINVLKVSDDSKISVI